jgi:hypothetical protein
MCYTSLVHMQPAGWHRCGGVPGLCQRLPALMSYILPFFTARACCICLCAVRAHRDIAHTVAQVPKRFLSATSYFGSAHSAQFRDIEENGTGMHVFAIRIFHALTTASTAGGASGASYHQVTVPSRTFQHLRGLREVL